ncbi:Ig-like domain-containing protein, partial [Paraburkholderia sp. Kb1A]
YTVTDAAGHVSSPSPTTHVRIYTMGPDKPEIGEVIDDVGLVQGPVGNGESTDDTTPTLVGKGEPGDTIVVIDNGTPIGETEVDEDGNWSFTPDTPLDEGEHEFTVVERDPAGNESKPSDPHVVIIDTTVPAPVITAVIDDVGPIQGPVASGGETDDTQPTVQGTAQAGSTVSVYDNGKLLGTTEADSSGNWSFTPPTPLSKGDHELTAVATSQAGNTSESSDAFNFSLSLSGSYSADPDGDWSGIATPSSGARTWASVPTGDTVLKDGVYEYVRYAGADPHMPNDETIWYVSLTPPAGEKVLSFSVDFGAIDVSNHFFVVIYDLNNQQIGKVPLVVDGSSHFEYTAPEGQGILRWELHCDRFTEHFEASNLSYQTDAGVSASGMSIDADVPVDIFGVEELNDSDPALDGDDQPVINTSSDGDVLVDSDVGVQELNDSDPAPDGDDQPVVETSTGNPDTVSGLQGIEPSAGVDGDIHTESGVDTLTLMGSALMGSGLVLDLANVGEKLSSVEVFDITGTGNNTLKLSLGDVLEQGGKDLFIADGRTQVMVKGDAGDRVELSDLLPDGEDIGDWTQQSGNTTVDGIEYDVFYHSGLNAELLVQHGVETVLNNH